MDGVILNRLSSSDNVSGKRTEIHAENRKVRRRVRFITTLAFCVTVVFSGSAGAALIANWQFDEAAGSITNAIDSVAGKTWTHDGDWTLNGSGQSVVDGLINSTVDYSGAEQVTAGSVFVRVDYEPWTFTGNVQQRVGFRFALDGGGSYTPYVKFRGRTSNPFAGFEAANQQSIDVTSATGASIIFEIDIDNNTYSWWYDDDRSGAYSAVETDVSLGNNVVAFDQAYFHNTQFTSSPLGVDQLLYGTDFNEIAGGSPAASEYFIDPIGGNNSNTGTATNEAWQTLAKASSQNFSPGDRILLKRGESFTGMLDISGEIGAAGSPILISDYGTSPDRAVIDATGESRAINVSACEHIEIENLEIIGSGISGEAWNWTSPGKAWNHYHFRNLYIHDIPNSGISLGVSNLGGYTYKDVLVSNCVFDTIGGTGITVNKWAGEAVKTVDNIGAADPARTPGTYTNVQAANLTRSQIIPAEFTVTVDGSGAASIEVTYKGSGYKENDQLLFDDADLGGGGAADLMCQVDGIRPAAPNGFYHEDLVIRDNTIRNTIGAGMQFGKCRNGLVEGNTVNNTGDGTGGSSGLWSWFCGTPSTTFVVQRNVFTGARGETDACGAHIDIGCVNTIFQYNLSMDNEGGFMEILGQASNCVYRYNVSINDGSRINGVNGARQHGKTFWLGGYTGQGGTRAGAFNSYVYNNTVFVKSDIVSKYRMESTASGALFANNVIYVQGTAEDISTDWPGGPGAGVIFDNNLVFENKVPASPFNTVTNNWAADPKYLNAGAPDAGAYKPVNFGQIIDRAINLYNIPGDAMGVAGGFAVSEDFFGNPIVGQPDMGAIEVESEFSTLLAWMDTYGIALDEDLTRDLNGDGVSLLAAYSQNLDPNRDLSGAVPQLLHNSGAHAMEMQYYAAADSIGYEIQETTNLLSGWIPFQSGALSSPDQDGNIMATVPLTNNLDRLFLRLRTALQ